MNTDTCDMVRISAEERDKLYGQDAQPGMFFWGTQVREVENAGP